MSISTITKVASLCLLLGVASVAAAKKLDNTDLDFMTKAAQSGKLEIGASTLAKKAAKSQQVKTFAEKMVTDHMKAADELKKLADDKGVPLPTAMTTAQQSKLNNLRKLEGAAFDKTYAREIGVTAHEKAVALFTQASKNAKDPDVKAYAAKTLPVLEGHLKMARTMNASVEKNQ